MITRLTNNIYPGEEFNISVIALDQIYYIVPTTVYVEKRYYNNVLIYRVINIVLVHLGNPKMIHTVLT